MSGKSKFQISRSLDERIKRIVKGSSESDSEFAKANSAYILGFNYGNVTNCVGLTTNYQLHHAVFPVVGLVFFRVSPSEDDIKSSLRSVREFSSSPNGLGSFKSDKNEHLFLIYSVERESDEVEKRIFNFTKGTFARRKRLRLNVLNDPFCPRQLPRGSEDLFKLDDVDSIEGGDDEPIDHLIFFIHGVGGVCDVRFRSCVEVVSDFKKMANDLLANQAETSSSRASTPSNRHLAQHFRKGFFRRHSTESSVASGVSDITAASGSSNTSRAQRIECLPVSWHSCTRKQTGISDQLSLVSLSSVSRLRHFLNKVVMDALVYACGPVYNQTIINNVGDEINRLYSLFLEKHPDFRGSVSLAGHSLGSVILFDLLANQIASNDSSSAPKESNLTDGPNVQDQTNPNHNNNNNEVHDTSNNNNLGGLSALSCGIVSHEHHFLKSAEPGCCMNYKNLEELLKDMNLTQHAGLFHKEHIDINTILLLTDLDLKELNLPLVARRKLVNYINFKKFSMVASKMRIEQNTQDGDENIGVKMMQRAIIENMNTGQCLVKYPQLKFKPRCFFAFGSPLPLFQTCRGMPEISRTYKLPTCDRIFNIFHPFDPLAYRMEPLIDPRYKDIEPVQIPHHRGGKRMHVQLREGFSRVSHDIKHRLLGSIKGTWSSITRYTSTEAGPSTEAQSDSITIRKTVSSDVEVEIECDSSDSGLDQAHRLRKLLKRQQIIDNRSDSELKSSDDQGSSYITESSRQSSQVECAMEDDSVLTNVSPNGKSPTSKSVTNEGVDGECFRDLEPDIENSMTIGQLNNGNRIDYVLQEKPIECFNEYIFAFISHASYWQNEDSALMLLKEIYKVDGIILE